MSFKNWQARLRGEKVTTYLQPQLDDEGYYRKPITEMKQNAAGHNNGQKRIIGWEPVAYFCDGDALYGVIGNRDMRPEEVTDETLWSYVCKNPISEEWFRIVEGGGAWPDSAVRFPDAPGIKKAVQRAMDGAGIPAANREVDKTDNQPPAEAELPLDQQHATAIDNAIGAAKDLKCTTVEEAARVAGAANVIRDRRLAAEKVAKARVMPLQLVYEEERNKWLPLVKRAKDEEGALRTKVSTFEAAERRRVAQEQLEAFNKLKEQEEANARAADRAIAAGVPEEAPVVEEVVIPQAAPRVAPTYGSYKPREKPVLKFAVLNEPLEVCKHFLKDPALIEVIQKLATTAVRNGLTVPGATFREGTE